MLDGNAGGRVDFFGGFLVLQPSAVWVKCKQRQTQGDMIQKSIGIYASFKMSDFVKKKNPGVSCFGLFLR